LRPTSHQPHAADGDGRHVESEADRDGQRDERRDDGDQHGPPQPRQPGGDP
jgi:hypothetical protein